MCIQQRGRNVNYDVKKWPWRWNNYKTFVYNQMEEILSRYGKVDILWLDGGWVCKENNQDIDMPKIAAMGRSHQPGLIMVDRTIHGPYENYQTPERTIPETQLTFPWESCIPLSNDWGYVNHPTWKTPEKVIGTLVEIVAKGGNLVLGVGPTPQGLIQPEAVERLQAIGKWLKANGEAIYNTTITPVYNDKNVWFTASKDGKYLYATYLPQANEAAPSTISWSNNVPKGQVVLLSNGKKLKTKVNESSVTVTLPANSTKVGEPFAMKLRVK